MTFSRNLRLALAAMVTLAIAPGAHAQASATPTAGNAITGKAIFSGRCAMCHGADAQGGAMGPRLRGVYGAKAASQAGQKYSAALKGAGLQWTPANLDAFLAKPQGLVRGTAMMAITSSPEDRRDVIAYLASLNDTPVPLPTAAK